MIYVTKPCSCYNGIDPLASVTIGGLDPKPCRSCGGAGVYHITENDRLIKWPGGPFDGAMPEGTFEKTAEEHPDKVSEWPPPGYESAA